MTRLHVLSHGSRRWRLALVGFGHVGRAFARLLLDRGRRLSERYGMEVVLTSILTQRHGWVADETGLDLAGFLEGEMLPERGQRPAIGSLPADVLVEVSTLDALTGRPALDYVREALEAGMHVITANKGPIAHGYKELRSLAERQGVELRFESAVGDDLPVFNLVRETLPTAEVLSVRGILNSTTNYLLSEVARGSTAEAALAQAQGAGIAERDTTADLEGFDAAVKAVILGNVLLGLALRVKDVVRRPVGEGVIAVARSVAREGKRLRMLASFDRDGARWEPVTLAPDDPFYAVDGFSLALELSTDVAGRLFVALLQPGVEQTAFGLLSDLVSLARR
jgi:homoserine dehydrogenase